MTKERLLRSLKINGKPVKVVCGQVIVPELLKTREVEEKTEEKMRTYTLTAYKPSGSSRNCSRGCCGSTDTGSDFDLHRGLTFEELVERIAKYRVAHDPDAHREEYRGPPWELKYFDDTGMSDWEWNEQREDYFSDDGFFAIDKKVEEMVAQAEPVVKQKQEQAEREAAEKAQKEEQIRQAKRATEEKERRDREEYARLQKKYANGAT